MSYSVTHLLKHNESLVRFLGGSATDLDVELPEKLYVAYGVYHNGSIAMVISRHLDSVEVLFNEQCTGAKLLGIQIYAPTVNCREE